MESSQNEDVMIIDGENEGLNECNMEDENFHVSFQTKQTNAKRIVLNEKNEMEGNLQTLHIKKKIWRGHNRNLIC